MKVLELILNRIFSFESKNQATRSVLDVLELVHHCIVASIMKAVTVISARDYDCLDKCVHLLSGEEAFQPDLSVSNNTWTSVA